MYLKIISFIFFMMHVPILVYAQNTQKAVFAGGCFWCVESNFEHLDGVVGAVSGFTGGISANPNYKSHGDHIEAVEITYDKNKISYEVLVDLFLRSTDVVDAGGQFCDRGHAYTSAIFASGNNANFAKKIITQFDASGYLPSNILTPILKPADFFSVGEYHQDYAMSEKKILTQRGFMSKANAYKFYRKSCGRDERIKKLWGNRGYFGVQKNK